ncbi:rhamnosyltransferase WsaF family glycosyltransferase [Hyalangium versicolor]|uniref:rhamnosyltransferase WsaF family glycosyltransferase n=1 Tax=Hyalangium versicolor TaxID=2861190 RepID=UPI001CCFC891|nr:glycosyltransferase [Hyalangium versicolor]
MSEQPSNLRPAPTGVPLSTPPSVQAAEGVADVFQFSVPESHRGQLGRAVTAAKSAFVKGLKPFHVELLRPQHTFNQEMLVVLGHVHAMRGTPTLRDLSGWVSARLTPHVEPTGWNVPGHRVRGVAQAVKLAKRSYLKAAGPLLREVLAGQREWNQAAVSLLTDAVSPHPPMRAEALRRVAELHALSDPLSRARSLEARVSSPLWREVFRRQVAFNHEVALCLAELLGVGPRPTAPSPEEYAAWCREREPALFARAAQAIQQLTNRPLVSIVTPVYETPEPILRACLDSVLAQSYENWECCLADDGSKSPRVAEVLAEYSRKDARIRVTRMERNGGIAAATNAAIGLARGEFVAFMDHDDLLAPHALAEMVLRISCEPDVELLYSDEDRFDNEGRRFYPRFKPDWSPDLLRSMNYFCHFVVVRRSLLERAGGLRPGFEGSQDYELVLRLSEQTQRIAHVPGVLYHWRRSGISFSQDTSKLRAASRAGARALEEHLRRLGEEGVVLETAPGEYRVRYPLRGRPQVSIIVPFQGEPERLRTLLQSLLRKTRYSRYELLLVFHGGAQSGQSELLKGLKDPRIRLLTWEHPFSAPAVYNFAARQAQGKLLLFLDAALEVIQEDWLEELISQAQRPEVGVVGARIQFPDGSVRHSGVVVGMTGFAGHPFYRMEGPAQWTPFGSSDWTRNYLAVTSDCLMVRREVFEALGGFDERLVVCGSDVDLGMRTVARGLRVVYTPHARLVHHGSEDSSPLPEGDFWASFIVYRPWLREGDPFYNPNLTLLTPGVSLRQLSESAESLTLRSRAGDLAEMITAERRVIDSMHPCRGERCEELDAHERTLQLLTAEFLQQLPGAPARAHTPLQAARLAADIFQFEVPPSHRRQWGKAVTAAKRAFVEGLRPFHIELLRPQHAFNQELLAVVEHFLHQRTLSAPLDEEGIHSRLGPLMDPVARGRQSSSERPVNRAIRLIERTYAQLAEPFVRDCLERQRRWNEEAVELLLVSAHPERLELEERARRVAELMQRTDPCAGASSLGGRLLSVAWREVFRRQHTFNREITLFLADALETRLPVETPPPEDYERWYTEREPARIDHVARAIASLESRPVISLLTVVRETPEPLLRACIESVRSQVYPQWQLCLVDEGSSAPHVAAVLEDYARRDTRIRVTRLPTQGGKVQSTRAALDLSRGPFVGFLEPDATLAPHALGEVALRLAREPEADVLYSDEDRVDAQGRRELPFLKPDWSPDLLHSVNYISHFLVVRRSLLVEAGGLRVGFEGAQEFELLLRLAERTQRIAHVPGILYHGKDSVLSSSREPSALQESSASGLRALKEHLSRRGAGAEAGEVAPLHYRVRYPVKGEPLVSIIVPFKDKPELLRTLTTSLEKTRYRNYELLLVSNNSTKPETFALLEALTDPRIRKLTWDFPFNYPAINNFAARHSKGELLLFLNNDIEIIEPLWLDELISQTQRPEVGAVGAKLLFPDGSIQHAGVVVGITGFAGHPFWRVPDTRYPTAFGHADWARNYLAVTSACVMLRREVFESLNGYDERFSVVGSDVDLGLRLVRQGLRVLYTPHATLFHHESASRRLDQMPENDLWCSFVAYRPWLRSGDPFYNPLLTLKGTDAGLRWHTEDGEALALETLAHDLPSMRQRVTAEQVARHRHVTDHLEVLDYTSARAQQVRTEAPSRLAALRSKGRVERVTWFLPAFHLPSTEFEPVLRFAEVLRDRHGIQNEFVISDSLHVSVAEMEARTAVLFPKPPGTFHILKGPEEIASLPACDLAIATTWQSVYSALAHPSAGVLARFVHRLESVSSEGTLSALAEQTYRLGLYGFFNTRGVYEAITTRYPMEGTWFEPAVDRSLFHARRPERRGPVRVFFTGHPGMEGNAFELGITALRRLKKELGAAVEIVTAGERWSPEQYGLTGVITHLGLLPDARRAELYRVCDVGLDFMFATQPAYRLMELMACGVTVVTHDNPSSRWLLEDEHNVLLAEPTVSCVLEQLRRAVREPPLRERVRAAAAERMARTTWEDQVERVFANLMGGTSEAGAARKPQWATN